VKEESSAGETPMQAPIFYFPPQTSSSLFFQAKIRPLYFPVYSKGYPTPYRYLKRMLSVQYGKEDDSFELSYLRGQNVEKNIPGCGDDPFRSQMQPMCFCYLLQRDSRTRSVRKCPLGPRKCPLGPKRCPLGPRRCLLCTFF